MSRFRVGLTGGLASGKSTVARWLAEAGFAVYDADRLVAELYAPFQPGAKAVSVLFGSDFLDPEGAVDKAKLAARVFADPEARKKLEAAIHPLVGARFAELAAAAPGVVVYEATLLAESGHAKNFDLVITVEAPEDLRLARAIARGLDEASARARLKAQGDGAARRAAAGRTIDNSGDVADLRSAVDVLIADLREIEAQ